jgi:hypothetical protein
MRTRTGKTVLIVLMVLLLAVIMQHVVGNHPKHLANTAGPVSAPKQAQTPAPSPTPAATPAPKESLPAKPKKRKAVDAAVIDLQVVFSAQFLAPDQMQKSLKAILVPSLLPTYLKQLPKSGDALARSWGYTSTYDALANASIQVETQKYKVYRFTHSRADIMLYSVTYFKGRQVQKVDGEDTVQYYQYHVPAITIVKMRWVDGFSQVQVSVQFRVFPDCPIRRTSSAERSTRPHRPPSAPPSTGSPTRKPRACSGS